MPKNPKDVLSSESTNPKPKGPLGYSGSSLLGKAADWYANREIFGDLEPKRVRPNQVPILNPTSIPGAPPGTVNEDQLNIVAMSYVSPESGKTHQIEGYHLPARPGKPTIVFFGRIGYGPYVREL
ncbi:MAG: hypothetical protein IPK22_28790 [Verrucomicrobiaceae bacterium]|nr:hypothetical protein [Verrucomicrobiaceae bacterium]